MFRVEVFDLEGGGDGVVGRLGYAIEGYIVEWSAFLDAACPRRRGDVIEWDVL